MPPSAAQRRSVLEPLALREAEPPGLLIVVRLGVRTLEDDHLTRSVQECHARWGIWGFSVLEVPDSDYEQLARLRPIVTERRQLLTADGHDLINAGFPLIATLDAPHWTVVLAAPTLDQYERVRTLFSGPIDNPVFKHRRPVS